MKMRKILLLLLFAFMIYGRGFAQFYSEPDVLTYLNGKTFTKASAGASLSFSEMGSQLSLNGKLMFYQPNIKILSRNSALVTYIGITDPSLKAGLIVDSSSDAINDRSNGSVYSLNKSSVENNSEIRNNSKNSIEARGDLNFFTGTFTFKNTDIKVVISNSGGKLYAVVYKAGKLFSFNTTCGKISKFTQEAWENPERIGAEITVYLTPADCKEPGEEAYTRPNYIRIDSGNASAISPSDRFFYLNVDIHCEDLKAGATVKRVEF